MYKEKILFDTDIGSDIDDAITLAYLLKQPKCELLGITTVSGESDKRAMIASAVCNAAGNNDIPIYSGTELPLLTAQRQPIAKQAGELHKWKHEINFPRNEHIEFMRQTIRKNPNEITLLAVGPMTNIALLFSVDPEIPKLLKQLILMCGIFTYKTPYSSCLTEWNAMCDPHAASIVYNAPVKKIKSIGLDVTTQVVMDRKEVTKNFTAEILKPVVDFSNVWFNEVGNITFHDTLAAVTIFDETVCGFKRGKIEVELNSPRSKGLLYFDENEEGNNEIAVTVDIGKFFKHYFNTVNS